MKRLSIKQGILQAIENTDENLGRYMAQSMKWAKHIEKEIGSALGYKVKSKAITLTGCYLTIPSDCYQVIGVFPGNYEDECNIQYRNLVNPLIQEDDVTGLWMPANTTFIKELFWQEIGDELHMIQSYENQEMTIVYQYNETDEQGDWLVNESHIEAIARYIEYMYSRKFRFKMFKSDKLLRSGHVATIEDLKRDYNIAVRNARAQDGRETLFEKEQY